MGDSTADAAAATAAAGGGVHGGHGGATLSRAVLNDLLHFNSAAFFTWVTNACVHGCGGGACRVARCVPCVPCVMVPGASAPPARHLRATPATCDTTSIAPPRHGLASAVAQNWAVLLAGPCHAAVLAPYCPTQHCPATPRSYLLPPVIFYAGLSVQRRLFFRNLPTILR